MKKILQVIFVAFFIGGATIASANLLGNGNFDDGTADINGSLYLLGDPNPARSDTEEWYALSAATAWSLESGGPGSSVYYFDHLGAGGGDQAIFQPVDTSSMSLTGAEVTLSFDYLFEEGDWDIQNMGVAIVGLSGSGAQYIANGGAGFDGYAFPGWVGPDAATSRDVYSQTSLDYTLDPFGNTWWENKTITATLTQDYDVLIAVVRSSAWNLTGYAGDRAVDNFIMEVEVASVPEPATMLLFGTSLVVLGGSRIRKRK